MSPSMLEGKGAVITGAGSTLGRTLVQLFSQEGARVAATDASLSALDAFARLPSTLALAADLTSQAAVDKLFEEVVAAFGRVDILVNNAGIEDQSLPLAETSDEVWQRVLDGNLGGPYHTCHTAISLMMRAGSGVIVNVAPLVGGPGGKHGAAAMASYRGVVGLTRNIAATFYGTSIRCLAICPGGGKPMLDDADAGDLHRVAPGDVPLDIAKVVLFAASDAARYVNGTVIVADGGWMAH